MSSDARDFNKTETRTVVKFFFPARQGAEGNSRHSDRNIRGTCIIISHRQKLGGPVQTVTTTEIFDQIHELILEDRRISAKSVAEQLGISYEQVGSIIHEDFDMRKLSAKWVPKCLLKAYQKR